MYYYYVCHPYVDDRQKSFFNKYSPQNSIILRPVFTPYGVMYTPLISNDFNDLGNTRYGWIGGHPKPFPNYSDSLALTVSISKGTFKIPTSMDELTGALEHAWNQAENKWHEAVSYAKQHAKLPTTSYGKLQGTNIFYKSIVAMETEYVNFIKTEVYEATEELKKQAIDKYNNLTEEAKRQANNRWEALKADAIEWTGADTYVDFIYKVKELGMEVFDALDKLRKLLNQIRGIQRLFQPCPSGMEVHAMEIFKTQIPIINKFYRLALDFCHPPGIKMNTSEAISDLRVTITKQAEEAITRNVLQAVVVEGFSGILIGIQDGFAEVGRKLIPWVEDWATKKGEAELQKAKNSFSVHIRFYQA